MYGSGVLLLTKSLSCCSSKNIKTLLENVSKLVQNRLVVQFQPGLQPSVIDSYDRTSNVRYTQQLRSCISELYRESAIYTSFDTRIILTNVGQSSERLPISNVCDVIFVDQNINDTSTDMLRQHVLKCLYGNVDNSKVDVVGMEASVDIEPQSSAVDHLIRTYPHVCGGGTFDRLHTGHKVLLTEICALAEDEVTIGVTEPTMNQKKVLHELIQPTQARISDVKEFVSSIKPGLKYNVVPIADIYGPSVVIDPLGCLVVSDETQKGGQLVNEQRRLKGLNEAEVYCIPLLEDSHHSQYEEEKISSSSLRKRLLGTLLKTPKALDSGKHPYLIGLTGGIASGKSSVAASLQRLGAVIIDCDKLGHKAYLKGSKAFHQIVDTFGAEVVGEDGEINRRVLGPKVFAAKGEMEKLNNIVWPAIAELCQKSIAENSTADVIVLDAAVLIEAGWDSFVHEVWTTLVPRDEAVKRIMERNGLDEQSAAKRIDAQSSNQDKVDRANVVICTLWEYEYTGQQVEKAWSLLRERIAGITQ